MAKTTLKTTTLYIKCSAEEAAAIRTAAKMEQRTVHNWLRMVVLNPAKDAEGMKKGDPLPELDIPLTDIGKLSASDLLAIDGPKFITNRSGVGGGATLAVVISHDKWLMLNHHIPTVKRREVTEFFVGDQTYLTIPVKRIGLGPSIWQAEPETGIKIITTSAKEVEI
jgi:hypothetical protein